MNNTEKKLLEALAYLADNVDEDCPTECRTTHLDEALHDARALVMIYAGATYSQSEERP